MLRKIFDFKEKKKKKHLLELDQLVSGGVQTFHHSLGTIRGFVEPGLQRSAILLQRGHLLAGQHVATRQNDLTYLIEAGGDRPRVRFQVHFDLLYTR